MLQDENMLDSQNVELTTQTNTLESDRLKLMKQLRHNAAQIGESGILFMVLIADYIINVT